MLSSQPPGARVVIDGEPAGVTPVALSLSPGTHHVVAIAEGGASRNLGVDVEAGQSVSRHVVLEPLSPNPAAPSSPARSMVAGASTNGGGGAAPRAPVTNGWAAFSLPFDAQVYQGSTFLGLTTDERLYARPGTHTFTLVNDQLGFRVDETVVVAAGIVTRRVVDPGTAALSVVTQPPSEVVIAGRSFGATPLANVSLLLGVHQVTLRHPTLGDRVLPVTIRRGAPNRLDVDLRP